MENKVEVEVEDTISDPDQVGHKPTWGIFKMTTFSFGSGFGFNSGFQPHKAMYDTPGFGSGSNLWLKALAPFYIF